MQTIVKVQIPLGGDMDGALIYDETRELYRTMRVTPELLAAMAGEPKQFFYATIDGDEYSLNGYAPSQDW